MVALSVEQLDAVSEGTAMSREWSPSAPLLTGELEPVVDPPLRRQAGPGREAVRGGHGDVGPPSGEGPEASGSMEALVVDTAEVKCIPPERRCAEAGCSADTVD